MADLSKSELEALRKANARAEIDKCKTILAGDFEHVRAAFWNRLPERTRMMICLSAGLDKSKGQGPLQALDAAERARINAEARRVIRDMETIIRCAQGGKTHDHGEMTGHLFDGIASIGPVQ